MAEVYSLSLHRHPDFIEQTVDILNEEWPRSRTARRHMLEKSNDTFPYSLILLEKENNERAHVIGHSRLCQVHGQVEACFVESVVVRKSQRGKGFGRILMEESEKHATRLGINTIYLTTHDKQDFYGHIGYTYCEPVLSFGGASKLIPESLATSLFGKLNVTSPESKKATQSQETLVRNLKTNTEPSQKGSSKTVSDLSENKVLIHESLQDTLESSNDKLLKKEDVGLSPSQMSSSHSTKVLGKGDKNYMGLPSPPSAPPPPPPPPPPTPPLASVETSIHKESKDTSEKVQRFGGKVYWMKKIIAES